MIELSDVTTQATKTGVPDYIVMEFVHGPTQLRTSGIVSRKYFYRDMDTLFTRLTERVSDA